MMGLDWNAEATDVEPRVDICGHAFSRNVSCDGSRVDYRTGDLLGCWATVYESVLGLGATVGTYETGSGRAEGHGLGDTPEAAIGSAMLALGRTASGEYHDRWVRWWSGADAG